MYFSIRTLNLRINTYSFVFLLLFGQNIDTFLMTLKFLGYFVSCFFFKLTTLLFETKFMVEHLEIIFFTEKYFTYVINVT